LDRVNKEKNVATFTATLKGTNGPVRIVAKTGQGEEFTFVVTINGEDHRSYNMRGSYITCFQAVVLRLIEEGVLPNEPFFRKLK